MRLITFVLHPVSTLLLVMYLRQLGWIGRLATSRVGLIYLLLPVFGARVANINFAASALVCLFLVALCLSNSDYLSARVFGFLPLAASMFMPSLQFFSLVPIAILSVKLFRKEIAFTYSRISFLVALIGLPILARYWVPLQFPSLRIENYNQIGFSRLVRAICILVLLSLPLIVLGWRHLRGAIAGSSTLLTSVGSAVLAVGTFPYVAVGHFATLSEWILPFLPDESDWYSRHQVLQGFGFSILIAGFLESTRGSKRSLLIVAVCALIPINFSTYSAYYIDAIKQDEIVQALRDEGSSLAKASAVLVVDHATQFNARGRGPRPWELSGLIKRALDREIPADGELLSACIALQPSHLVVIESSQGRLRSLLTRSAGITIDVFPAPRCAAPATTYQSRPSSRLPNP